MQVMDPATWRIDLDDEVWTQVAEGFREKRVERHGRRLRLIEVGRGFEEDDWCNRGHVGVVVDGNLSLVTPDGEVRLGPGEALVVPEGGAHRARVADGDTVQLLLVEEARTGSTTRAHRCHTLYVAAPIPAPYV